jgi:MFS transporter, UMF1 family
MRYVCLTESGDWQTYVIFGKLCKMKGYEICLPHRTGRLADICYIRQACRRNKEFRILIGGNLPDTKDSFLKISEIRSNIYYLATPGHKKDHLKTITKPRSTKHHMEKTIQAPYPINNKRTINAWAMFDWANSSYALVISTAIFPMYFNQVMSEENFDFLGIPVNRSALFSYALSFAYLVIASVLPLLTGIADYSGRRKTFMKAFTIMGSIACACMFFFQGMDTKYWGVFSFVFAVIGFEGGKTFYNSYLPLITTEDQYDKVSAKGFTFGYIGSVLLLMLNLVMIMNPTWFGLPDATMATRVSFVTVGLWWLGFAQIPFFRLPNDIKGAWSTALFSKGYKEIRAVANYVKGQKNILYFLLAFFFYSAGALTVIGLASTFAVEELGFEAMELILLILVLQFVGIIGAELAARFSGRRGNKLTIVIILLIWMAVCIAAYFVQVKAHFYVVAAFTGLVMGGIQSMSRSTYSKLIPEQTHSTASFFSFFDVCEKLSMVLGPFLFGFIAYYTGSMRNSIFSLVLYFLLGLIFLRFVKVKQTSGI